MNRLLPFIAFLLLMASSVEAQRLKLFRSIIYTAQGERIDGILYDMTDSTVQYVPDQPDVIQRLRDGQMPATFDCHWQDIDRIVIRRKGGVGRGMLVGGGVGLAIGVGCIALINPADGLANLGLAAAGLASPFAGLLYGGLSSIKPYRVRHINHEWEAYRNAKASLKWLSVAAQRRVMAADAANVSNRP